MCAVPAKRQKQLVHEKKKIWRAGHLVLKVRLTKIFMDRLKKPERIAWYFAKPTVDRYLILGSDSRETYSYSPLTDEIRNANGKIIINNKPSILNLAEYESKINSLPVPITKFENSRNILLNYPDIYFDEISRAYKNVNTNDTEYGFKIPDLGLT